MSIAVSAVVRPSRILTALLVGLCVGLFWIAYLLSFGYAGNFHPAWRIIIAFVLLAIPVSAIFGVIGDRKWLHIDISYNGQIKVEEDKTMAARSRQEDRWQKRDSGKVVTLMPNSTIWPHLLLLRLQAEDRKIMNVLILPDCMNANSYRALTVACRWIAARNNHAER